MISAAIQTELKKIITNTYLVMGDEGIVTPYCVHKEAGVPQYLKQGLIGYLYDCEVVVIDKTPGAVETLAMRIKTALEALAGTTTNSTKIDGVEFTGDAPDYDVESKLYINILSFTIETSNR